MIQRSHSSVITSDRYMVGKTVLAPQLTPLTSLPNAKGTIELAGLETPTRMAAAIAKALFAIMAPRRPSLSARNPAVRLPIKPPMAQMETTTEKRKVTRLTLSSLPSRSRVELIQRLIEVDGVLITELL